jgi:hypothetical protein
VTASGNQPGDADTEWPEIDTTKAHAARVYDYWLGGKANFAVDRVAADQATAANPEIVPAVRANRAFLRRSVRYLAGPAGVRQFLDIGTGIPSADNTHEVAQRIAPQARIVYVDNDPIVLAHAHHLLKSTKEGACRYLSADLGDPGKILDEAADTLDFSRPTAVMLMAILQYVPDSGSPHAIVRRLMAAFPPDSYLVISHPAKDIGAQQVAESMRRYNEHAADQATPRTHAEVARFFTGLDLLEPGVVQLTEWRPDGGPRSGEPAAPLPMWCGVGRKT